MSPALSGAATEATEPASALQLQSETQRKLELRDSDMGDVCVVASNVGVAGRCSTAASTCAVGRTLHHQ